MLLEICANSFKSALNAQQAGAQRIELCVELGVGGITPSFGMVEQVLAHVTIPVFVLIRPRSGHFCYTNSELTVMQADIKRYKSMGCHGFVSGVLNQDQTINISAVKQLIVACGSLPFTFHRAFDWTPDPIKALDSLISLGVNRVLTSGQAASAFEGLDSLIKFKSYSENRLIIMPGGGVTTENILKFKANMFTEIHASATSVRELLMTKKVGMNSLKSIGDTISVVSDLETIKSLIKRIR
ncbi:MAG: Copper homeostasis protein CutC [Formosa sp. Hel1_33_131]|nr:MAG: Copper homeostasis protein CutC [Formosa sp. Hel1_33_131]|tara:strand:+ start:755 stop:1477 length:723 start_codon:yes stop_codon:yes gene_type:complete